MSYQPIAENQNFAAVRNTAVSANSVYDAQQVGRLSQTRAVQGWVDSKAPASYTGSGYHYHDLMDNEGNFIELTPGMIITNVTYGAVPFGKLLGGTDVTIGLSPVPVSSSSWDPVNWSATTADALLASVNLNVQAPPSVTTGITDTYLVVRLNGAFTQQTLDDGTMYYPKVAVKVTYQDTQDINRTGLPGPHQYPSSGSLAAYEPFVSASALTPGSK